MMSPGARSMRTMSPRCESPLAKQGTICISLQRDGQCVPWGLRLVGGSDCGNTALIVQKVISGSPASDSGLRSGDLLVAIGNQSTMSPPMSHQAATNLIKRAGNNLDVTVHRGHGIAYSSPSNSPTPPYLRTLPTSVGVIPNFDHQNANLPVEQEKQIYESEKRRERDAVVSQPYRTLPVVQPKPKPRHDYPTGSYLKYVQDPQMRASPTPASHYNQPDKLRQVITKMAANVDPNKIVNLQYNSPINIYSNDNVAEALVPQMSGSPMGHHSPRGGIRVNQPPPLIRPVDDITLSPTYQLVQEQEMGRQHGPVKDRLYTVTTTPQEDEHFRPEFPAQSHTFNTLRTSLLQHPKC